MQKLKLFAKGTVTEIHDETGAVIVSWAGFDDSAIPLHTHRKRAAEFVTAANAYPVLLAALEEAETHIRDLEIAARELSITFAQVPTDWNIEWAKDAAGRAVKADTQLRALLEKAKP